MLSLHLDGSHHSISKDDATLKKLYTSIIYLSSVFLVRLCVSTMPHSVESYSKELSDYAADPLYLYLQKETLSD